MHFDTVSGHGQVRRRLWPAKPLNPKPCRHWKFGAGRSGFRVQKAQEGSSGLCAEGLWEGLLPEATDKYGETIGDQAPEVCGVLFKVHHLLRLRFVFCNHQT